AGMLLSMLAAPFVIERARSIGERMSRDEWLRHSAALQEVAAHTMGIRDHAIVCGYGRTGQNVARFLYKEKIPFIALDMDAHRVQQALTAGENVVFGNAGRLEVLLAAGLERARIVVVTSPDVPSAVKILGIVRARRPELPVIVRAADDAHLDELRHAGATEVVPEVMEGSLMLAAQTLTRLDVPLRRVLRDVDEARRRRYEFLRERYLSAAADEFAPAAEREEDGAER
ncbi:MAG: NAD-binding protein, partial [Rhodocyclaceae bacterium]|nr:NAD-binding protein [Rhodocyclaceae bacterium]